MDSKDDFLFFYFYLFIFFLVFESLEKKMKGLPYQFVVVGDDTYFKARKMNILSFSLLYLQHL